MEKKFFEKAIKIAELTKPKEREIHVVEFWYKNENLIVFKITLDNGKHFFVDILI